MVTTIYNLSNVLYKSGTKLLHFYDIRNSFVHFFVFLLFFSSKRTEIFRNSNPSKNNNDIFFQKNLHI